MIIEWLTKKMFVKGWKKVFGREPQRAEDTLIDTIPAELERLYGVKIQNDIWTRFVDGINRLPRPLFTFGLLYLFSLGLWDPLKLQEYFFTLSKAPGMFWTVSLTILAFWFGSKIIEKSPLNFDIQKWKAKMDMVDRIKVIKEFEKLDKVTKEGPSSTS